MNLLSDTCILATSWQDGMPGLTLIASQDFVSSTLYCGVIHHLKGSTRPLTHKLESFPCARHKVEKFPLASQSCLVHFHF